MLNWQKTEVMENFMCAANDGRWRFRIYRLDNEGTEYFIMYVAKDGKFYIERGIESRSLHVLKSKAQRMVDNDR